MKVNDIKIKGAKAEGNYKLKGFEKDDIYIGKNHIDVYKRQGEMLMQDDSVIVVFGGSFNPPLNSHFSLAEQIISEYKNVEKVIFVPVSEKYEKAGLLNDKYRYEMLKCVCDKNEKFEVSDIELRKKRQLFTIETLEKLQEKYKDKTIWFTTGSDNLKELNLSLIHI